AGSDELWEVTTQMNIPGLPAGMGGSTQQVCRDKDPRKDATRGKDRENCKVTDLKQTGTRMTLTMTCPDGKMVLEHNYNASRTEYKGTMRMTGRQGDMTMNMSGRKIGNCDAVQAKGERDAKSAQMKADADRMKVDMDKRLAEARAQQEERRKMDEQARAKADAEQIQKCRVGVKYMDLNLLTIQEMCYRKPDANCRTMMSNEAKQRPEVAKVCNASGGEYCKRYQTPEGLRLVLNADNRGIGDAPERSEKMCGMSAEKLKASLCASSIKTRSSLDFVAEACAEDVKPVAADLCPNAVKSESLIYLGTFCPVDAKPYADKYCKGRSYSSTDGEHDEFCKAYLSRANFRAPQSDRRSRRQQAEEKAGPADEQKGGDDAVSQGVNEGIKALKGIFGR
ncbi:MAG: DUF3617 domain-containing protein, partial [Betaproteobacteria bacterium]|nr:DUF3617 domain-containing protein [Betaproteobacteria bacterium]